MFGNTDAAALRMFCTLPVSIGSSERSFSVLLRIKNYYRLCATQTRVSGPAALFLGPELARKLDVGVIIEKFASTKERKANSR